MLADLWRDRMEMSHDTSALYGDGASELNIGVVGISDVAQLEENVRIAGAFEPLTEEGMTEVRALAQSGPG